MNPDEIQPPNKDIVVPQKFLDDQIYLMAVKVAIHSLSRINIRLNGTITQRTFEKVMKQMQVWERGLEKATNTDKLIEALNKNQQ